MAAASTSADRTPGRRGCGGELVVALLLAIVCCSSGTAHGAEASDPLPRGPSAGRIAGATLGAFGAAAALGAGLGSLSHLVRREHSGVWGWINLLAGTLMLGGGVLLVDHGGLATQVGGHLTIAVGVLSVGVGLAGLSLQRPEAQAPLWRRWRLRPAWLQADRQGAQPLPGLVWRGVL